MSVTLAPDVEKIISAYLRTHADMVALSARVVGKTPSDTSTPWVRVTQLDDRTVGGSRSEHLHEYFLQFDCYAGNDGGQPEASTLGRTLRALLVDAPNASHDAVVSGVDIRGHARVPDVDVDEPARERVIVSALVWMHP